MKLSPHFMLREFTRSDTAKRLGILNSPNATQTENLKRLALTLEEVRSLLGHPIIITSGYRSPALNRAVGGSTKSDHSHGLAADFHCPGFGSVQEVCLAIENSGINFDQLIFEQGSRSDWVHLGIGDRMRREVMSWKSGKGYFNGVLRL